MIPISMSGGKILNAPLLTFAWRNIWRNPKRTLILLMVFTLGIATMLIFQSLMNAWTKSMLDNALENLTNDLQIHQKAYRDDPVVTHYFKPTSELRKQLSILPLTWTSRIKVSGMIQSEYESFPVTVIGIQPETEKSMSFIGHSVVKGQYFTSGQAKGLLIGKRLMNRLQTQLNRRVVVMSQTTHNQLGELGVRLVGVYHHSDPKVEETTVFMPLVQTQNLLELGSGIHEISIKAENNKDKAALMSIRSALQKNLPSDWVVEPWWELAPFIEATSEMMGQFVYVWLGFILLLMVFGMLNTLMMSLYERGNEFRMLFTLGLSAARIRLLVLIEMTWLLLLSIVTALLLVWAFVQFTAEGINLHKYAEGLAWFGASQKLYIQGEPRLWGEVVIASFALILLFSLWPIWRATSYHKLQKRL